MPLNLRLNLKAIILCVTIAVIGLNLVYVTINVLSKLQNPVFYLEPGAQFADFKDKIKGEKIVGYMTNRDSSPEKNDQEFLMAQYMLAPTVLDFNNSNHKFLILDYTSPIFLAYEIKNLNVRPVYDNKFDKVLAVRNP